MKKGNSENFKGKRGKKGGTQFPRYGLGHLTPFVKNLVSKTHTNPITIQQLNAGVFSIGSDSVAGKVKSSALKQFGLLLGDYKKIKATPLASKISLADANDLQGHLREAFGNVKVFVDVLKTFQHSKVDKSKVGQYAVTTLKVHPDMKDDFIEVLIESALSSGLCTIEGSSITFNEIPAQIGSSSEKEDEQNDNDQIGDENSEEDLENSSSAKSPPNPNKRPPDIENGTPQTQLQKSASNINVNIDIDPSMDPEKLEKLLKLLKGYGAI